MATPAQRPNTWILDEWYDQAVAGTQGTYVGEQPLYMAGRNIQGNLAQNDATPGYSSPVQVGTNTNWESIRGSSRALAKATKTDGTLWIWGRNDFGGAIPGGESVDFSSPVQVPGTSWSSLVGGTNYSVAAITE